VLDAPTALSDEQAVTSDENASVKTTHRAQRMRDLFILDSCWNGVRMHGTFRRKAHPPKVKVDMAIAAQSALPCIHDSREQRYIPGLTLFLAQPRR